MKLLWNQPGQRFYEAGVDRGVLFPLLGPGVAWSGLISVEEMVAGGEAESYYFDGNKYLDFVASEDYQAVLTAFSSPEEFAICDGSKMLAMGLYATKQPRQTFGLSYRSGIGSDTNESFGYKLHLVYNATALPATKTATTLTATPEATSTAWTINTVPPAASTYKPTAHFIIDSTKTPSDKMTALEELIYGTPQTDSELPSQETVIALLSAPDI